MNKIWKENFRT